MPTIEITRENMADALEWVVSQFDSDYVYQNAFELCLYIKKGSCEGDCIFGKALIHLGVDPEFLSSVDNDESDLEEIGIDYVLRHLGVEDEELIDACRIVQMYQDTGTSWGRCVEIYHERLRGKHVIS